MSFGVLTPEDINLFATQGANLRQQYARQIARDTWERGQTGLEYKQAQAQMTGQFDRARNALPGQYVGRGMFNSGVYGQGLQEYAQDRTWATQNLSSGYQRKLGEISQRGQDSATTMKTGLDLIEAQKQAKRASLASQIRSIY